MVEIQGAPASGKTHFVYQLLVSCILPSPSTLGGWGKAAVVYDTDGTFQVGRLKTLLHAHISGKHNAAGDAINHSRIEDITLDCLHRLHVFRPTTSMQLAATIVNLGNLHATHPRFADQEIGLVVVDSLSAFYWQDRFTVEQFRAGPSGHNAKNPLMHVLAALDAIRVSHRPIILVTNWGLNPTDKPSWDTGTLNSPFFKQHLNVLPRPSPSSNNPSSRMTSDDRNAVHQQGQASSGPRENVDTSQNPASLPITYHITLRLVSASTVSAPTVSVAPDRELQGIRAHGNNGTHADTKSTSVEGFVRSSRNGHAIRTFTFQIGL